MGCRKPGSAIRSRALDLKEDPNPITEEKEMTDGH